MLIAVGDTHDTDFEQCVELLASHAGSLLVPALCMAEVSYVWRSRGALDSEAILLGLLASGVLMFEQVEPPDMERMAELVTAYRDLPLGATDASIVAAAERLGVTTIATLDKRDFAVVQPRHIDAFELVP